MATTNRFSYSLLISTVAFGLFAVVAFSGLFPWIEAQFYSPRVVVDLQQKLTQAETAADLWKTATLTKLDKLLADTSFDGVFSPTQSRDAMQRRFQSAKLFFLGVRGGGSLRIFNGDYSQLHFSTEDADVKAKTDFTITYHLYSELTGLPDLKAPALADRSVHVIVDPTARSLVFLRPWKDTAGLVSGWALMTVSLEDLRLSLVEGGMGLADQPIAALGPSEFVFAGAGTGLDTTLLNRVRDLAAKGVLPPVQRLATTSGVTVALVHQGHSQVVIPAAHLELDFTLKILVLASFYTVLFLIVFLIFNLRGEPISVVSRKVKRFQLQVVRQYLDLKEQDKIRSLRDELTRHSGEIRTGILRSLGRVRRKDKEWVDRYIDTSWQEVLDLLRGPEPPPEANGSNADWKRLEALLQQALTQGRFVVSGTGSPAVAAGKAAAQAPAKAPPGAPEDVEELGDVEELEDVEELGEEVEDAEAVDEVEELGDAEEAEAVEDLEEVEDAEEAEAVEDLEEVEDAEAEDFEEVAEAEAVEELEELEPEVPTGEGSEAELESLPERPRAAFPSRQGGAAVAELEAADAEELEELVDEPEEQASQDVEELEELAESDSTEIVTYELDRLDEAWAPAVEEVFDESGEVVSLTDEVFADAKPGRDDFGQLVDEVLAGPESGFVPLTEDLVPDRRNREWRWTGGGFDWDRFAGGDDDVSLFRALSDLVTAVDAFTAAILVASGDGWRAQSSVGFSDAGKEMLDFKADSPLTKACLSSRALHLVGAGSSVLESSFHAKDMKFLKAVVSVPLLFRREPAWLLLGLRQEPSDVLALLTPRRIG